MEFRFRAGDRRPRDPSSSAPFSRDRRLAPRGAFHGGPPPPQFEWEDAARRERIIREEVERRLIEQEVERRLVACARLHGGFGPGSFVGPDGPFPPPPDPFFRADGPRVPPPLDPFFGAYGPPAPPPPGPFFGAESADGPPLPPPPAGMHWNGPPPASSGPRRGSRFGQRILVGESRRRPLPSPKSKHKLERRKIESSESSEV